MEAETLIRVWHHLLATVGGLAMENCPEGKGILEAATPIFHPVVAATVAGKRQAGVVVLSS
jgi:hypothetical protein